MKFLQSDKRCGENVIVNVGDFFIGAEKKVIISGPCAVEDYEIMRKIAANLKKIGVNMLRGGAFKPRTSPYDFQGLELEGLKILKEIKNEFNMPVVSEVMDTRDVETSLDYIDVIQIGSRNMYNYSLLKEVGKTNVPILLKRGISATLKEWLNAAEYILSAGNEKVILCERGIRTYETSTRNTLDLNSVAILKNKYRLPVIVDPSHATGKRELIRTMSRAALMAGCDGLIIESHICPDNAMSDSAQTIDMNILKGIKQDTEKINNLLKALE